MYRLIVIMYGLYPSEPMPIAFPSLEVCQQSLEQVMKMEEIAERVKNDGWTVECADTLRYWQLKHG